MGKAETFYRQIRPKLLFFLLLSLPNVVLAQEENTVFIRGQVIEADSLSPLPYVHIRDEAGTTGTATDATGNFSVIVPLNDTIMFSSVGYKPYFLVPSDSSIANLRKLVVKMTPHVGELREVTVKAYDNIEQYIRREPEPFSLNRPKGEPLFERKEPQEVAAVRMAGGLNGARLEGGVTAFANLFNSKFQQEKKLREIMEIREEEERRQRIKEMMVERFQEMLVLANDDLSEAEIQRFTLEHMPPPSAMIYMDDYRVMLGIVESMKSFETDQERQLAVQKLLKTKVFEGESTTTRQ